MSACRLEDPHRPEDVHFGVVDGMLDRHAHVGLGREVEDGLGSHGVEQVVERLADVADVQLRAGGDVRFGAVDERVNDRDLVTTRDERIDDVRTDEAGSPGHDRPHGCILRSTWRPSGS